LATDEELRSAAAEILGANEFTRWHTGYESWLNLLERIGELIPDWLIQAYSWIQQAARAVFQWIAEVLRLFGVLGDVGEGIGWVAVCILVAALIVLGWNWQKRRKARDRRPDTSQRSAGRSHAQALREAAALARRGQTLEAAHRVQLATLALLIEFDWLELARSDPNRTLRRRLRESALPTRERHELISLVDRLEALWFDVPREDRLLFEDWVSLDERIVSIATGGRF
jgi:uncharacterized iron-regulated membrane protein